MFLVEVLIADGGKTRQTSNVEEKLQNDLNRTGVIRDERICD